MRSRTPIIALALRAGTALAFGMAVSPLAAQSIDHGALQDLFDEPVTTSVTGSPQRVSEVPAAMIVVSGEQIRRSGGLSLAEVLRGYAGIDVMRNSTQHYDVAIRGGNQPFSSRILVMVDGRQVYLDHYGFTSWSNVGVELAEIRQVEIVKGPMSALFGFNAASGVINIITFSPQTDDITGASGEIGTDGAYSVSGVGTLRLADRAGIRFSGGYSRQHEFVLAGPRSPISPYRENLAVDSGMPLGEQINARLSYSYSNSEQTTLATGFSPLGMALRTHDAQGKISAETGIGIVDASVEYKSLRNRYDDKLDGAYDGTFSNKVLIARLQDTTKLGARDTVRATAEYRYDSLVTVPDLAGKIRYHVYSGGLMWDHRFSDGVSLNFAGRLDHLILGHSGVIAPMVSFTAAEFDRAFTDWSANVGLVINPDSVSTIRLLAGRGVQSPSLTSLGVAIQAQPFPGVTARIFGDPGAGSTIVESAEAGYTRSIDGISGSLGISGFYTRTKSIAAFDRRLPTFVPGLGVLIDVKYLSGAGAFESYGLEMVADGRIGSALNWRLDYTYNIVKEDFPQRFLPIDRPFRALTPRHKLALRLSYDQGPFSIDGRAYMRSAATFPLDGRRTGTSVGLDARAAWRVRTGVELYAVGENLSENEYIDNGYARQQRRARLGARFGF